MKLFSRATHVCMYVFNEVSFFYCRYVATAYPDIEVSAIVQRPKELMVSFLFKDQSGSCLPLINLVTGVTLRPVLPETNKYLSTCTCTCIYMCPSASALDQPWKPLSSHGCHWYERQK